MKYGLFKRILTTTDGVVSISFTALQNPATPHEPLAIEADDENIAASKAGDLLEALGITTHSIDGCPDTIMAEFPRYFVGRFADELAVMYDTYRLRYEIDTFVPVPKA